MVTNIDTKTLLFDCNFMYPEFFHFVKYEINKRYGAKSTYKLNSAVNNWRKRIEGKKQ